MLCPVADVHPCHHGLHFLLSFRGREVHVAQRQLDVFIDVQLINQVEALKHKSYVSFAELRPLLLL